MQSIMSAFKRSSDKKHKRLLQDSLLSSTHSSFTQDENIQPEDSLLTRVDSLKPQQLLHTPSPSRSSRKTGFQRAFDDQALQVLDNTGVIDVVIFRLSVCMHVPARSADSWLTSAASSVTKAFVVSFCGTVETRSKSQLISIQASKKGLSH